MKQFGLLGPFLSVSHIR